MTFNLKSASKPNASLTLRFTLALGAALTLAGSPALAASKYPVTQQSTLLDRIQIEDVMIQYMSALEGNDPAEYGGYFTNDAVLNINGLIYRGPQGAARFVQEGENDRSPLTKSKIHISLSNPRIVVSGNKATATSLWTIVTNDNVKAPPRILEQGCYDDELVKQNGVWLFSKRVITSEGGMPDMYDKTYKPR